MTNIGYFRKKPVVIQAIRWTGNNATEIMDWKNKNHGDMEASKNDWIILGVNGEIYPCKPDIFKKTYEPVIP